MLMNITKAGVSRISEHISEENKAYVSKQQTTSVGGQMRRRPYTATGIGSLAIMPFVCGTAHGAL